MTQAHTLRRGAAWIFAGRTGDQLLGFAFGVVLARLLAPEDFGMLLTIQVFTGLAGFVSGGGMGQALVRAREPLKSDYDIVFTLQLMIGCVIYGLFFVTAPLFSRWYDNALFTNLIRLSALSFIFRPLVNLPGSVLYRNMRFKAQSIIGLITLIMSSATSIFLAYHGFGVWSLIWGGIAGSLLQSILMIYVSKWRPGFSLDFSRGGEMARYGFLVSANDIIDYIRTRISIFILSQSVGPASLGLYNKGESLAKMPHSFITGSVYHVLFRAMGAEQDNLERCRHLFFRSLALVAVYATPFYVGIFWLAEPLVRGVYGEKWAPAAGPMMVLAFAWPFWLLINLSGAVVAVKNRLGSELVVQSATLIVTVVAVIAGLRFGIVGVAWAIVATAVLTSFLMYRLAIQCLDADWLDLWPTLAPALILNGILAIALFSVEHVLPDLFLRHDLLHVAAVGSMGVVVYALSALFLPIPALESERFRWRARLRLPISMRTS